MKSIEVLRKKISMPLPMQGVERTLFLSVILVFAMGVVQSVKFGDWQWFERSGSLLILIAIFLAWYDYVEMLGDARLFYAKKFAEQIDNLQKSKPAGIIAGVMHDGKIAECAVTAKEVDEVTEALRKRLNKIEAVILSLGTVVWGYGSVIGKLV